MPLIEKTVNKLIKLHSFRGGHRDIHNSSERDHKKHDYNEDEHRRNGIDSGKDRKASIIGCVDPEEMWCIIIGYGTRLYKLDDDHWGNIELFGTQNLRKYIYKIREEEGEELLYICVKKIGRCLKRRIGEDAYNSLSLHQKCVLICYIYSVGLHINIPLYDLLKKHMIGEAIAYMVSTSHLKDAYNNHTKIIHIPLMIRQNTTFPFVSHLISHTEWIKAVYTYTPKLINDYKQTIHDLLPSYDISGNTSTPIPPPSNYITTPTTKHKNNNNTLHQKKEINKYKQNNSQFTNTLEKQDHDQLQPVHGPILTFVPPTIRLAYMLNRNHQQPAHPYKNNCSMNTYKESEFGSLLPQPYESTHDYDY